MAHKAGVPKKYFERNNRNHNRIVSWKLKQTMKFSEFFFSMEEHAAVAMEEDLEIQGFWPRFDEINMMTWEIILWLILS